MKINQVFEILQQAGGGRAARIITENIKKISWIRTRWMAYQLRQGVPVAKIIHQKWFFGLKFYTDRNTLDPRPDTETLVSAVVSDCVLETGPNILDLGTGTGCIICALCKNIVGARGVGVDKSWRALRVARRNIRCLGLGAKIRTVRASFNQAHDFGEKFDVIVSNPPYIARGDARVDVGASWDPGVALYADNNGLAAYESIAKNATGWIKLCGKMYLEIGEGQGDDVKSIFVNRGWAFVRAECDLAGVERVLVFEWGNNETINRC
ncbi:MAG: peptide chain release factor N(5)-glutamine methyltransferase [Alphaproteobacteria bacterium]|nr:peptide chain release factor N(5)-glutamine methyltransferase [Alphaproteobacteria bacterium]